MPTAETKVKEQLRRWWNKYPTLICLRPYCQPCSAGVHDYIGTVGGRAVSVEVKAPNKPLKYSPSQAVFAKQFALAGGLPILTNSVEDCKRQFTEAGVYSVSPKDK